MTGIDWVILGAVVLLALFGWAQGFLAGVLALAGFAAGAWLGTRVAPLVLEGGRESQWAPAFALVGALVAGGVLAASFEGVGARLRARFSSPAFAAVDGALGAALTACVGLLVAWVLGAVALQAGPDIRRDVQRSAILRQLNAVLPPTGPLLNTLRALDPFPRIDGPEARVPPPRAAIARDPQVGRRARQRGQDPRHRLRRRRRGLGLGGRRRAWWSPTPTWSPARTTRACWRAATSRASTRRRSPSTRATTSPSCAWTGSRRRRSSWRATRSRGTSAAILGFPLNGPYDVRAGPARRDARGGQPGRLRARPGAARDRRRCAAPCAPATPAARWSTAPAAS